MSTTLYPAPHLVVIGARAQFVGGDKSCARSDLRYFAPSCAAPAIVDGVFGTIVRDQSPAGWTFTPTKPPAARISIRVRGGHSELTIRRADGDYAVIASCNLTTGDVRYSAYTGVNDGVWRSRSAPDGYDLSCSAQCPEYHLQKALDFLDFSRRAPALERVA